MDLPPIVCISNLPWDWPVPTNRDQLMRRFALRTPVVVIEDPLALVGSFVGRSKFRNRRHGWRRDGDIRILQAWDWIPPPLARRSDALSRFNDRWFRSYIVDEWKRLRLPAPVLWLYRSDGGDLLGQFGERMSVYHCIEPYDALAHFTKYQRTTLYRPEKGEAHLVQVADLVVVSAPPMFDQWHPLNPNTIHMPNAADTRVFQQALDDGPEHPALAGIPRPRIGYIGKFDVYKIDFALLTQLADLCPDLQFVCVGPLRGVEHGMRPPLPQRPNLHYVDTLPQQELPAILRGCSACIMPFQINEYTLGVSPLKLYEYLAAGQPVVAPPLPALRASDAEGLFLAQPTAEAFASRLREACDVPSQMRHRFSEWAQAFSWERRVDELEALILEELSAKAGEGHAGDEGISVGAQR